MSWAAANVPRRRQEGSDNNDGRHPASSKSKDQRKRGETVEAVLSRLSKAYSLSMECLGAMHQANATIIKQQRKQQQQKRSTTFDSDNGTSTSGTESIDALRNVATAARDTLEKALLMDPLIVEHSPTLRDAIQKYADRDDRINASASAGANDAGDDTSLERFIFLCRLRPEPPNISSKEKRSTIRQLAYLALTNYADLLMSVCTCGCAPQSTDTAINDNKKQTLLDRGVVKKLQGFAQKENATSTLIIGGSCCWANDSEEDIQRLALAALCDASVLDGSDPVVWLKLACAARAMGHIMTSEKGLTNPVLSPFRRLERHALEMGYTALPSNVPPNRAITKALQDINRGEMPDEYPSILAPTPEPCKLNLDLTRYSWSLLGRLLMKTLREGTGADESMLSDKRAFSSQQLQPVPFGSPTVSLNLSPMLCLPSRALTRILAYLKESDIWKFEATCRALSVSIMSVRAALERQGGGEEDRIIKEPPTTAIEQEDAVIECVDETDKSNEAPKEAANGENKVDDEGGAPAKTTKQTTVEPVKIGRTSKRVRSQQITSDKRDERLRKRKSVGFCLRAATLSTLEYSPQQEAPFAWDTIRGEQWQLPASLETNVPSGKGKSSSIEGARHQLEASERIGSSSLSNFLHRLSSQNAGPVDLLLQYLGHVALHVEEVFSVDPGDKMVLNSSITGCFELILHQHKFQNAMIPRFVDDKYNSPAPLFSQAMELFAMDLLNVELRFKVCERQKHFCISFDDDSSYVSCMMPMLLDGMANLDDVYNDAEKEHDWTKIKARVHWLAAGVFLWRSRLTNSVAESIEAEEQGLKYIGSTIACLSTPQSDPIGSVATPHLESPARTGVHWKALSREVLATYRDEIQAASVVSHAQQQFQERIAIILKCQREALNSAVIDEEIAQLPAIGAALLVRYSAPFGDADCKHGELLENFMSVHGDDLLSDTWEDVQNASHLRLIQAIPTTTIHRENCYDLSNPSIMTILTTCLQANAENRRRVAELLVRLILTALDRYEQLCRAATTKKAENESADNISDSDDDDSVADGTDENDYSGSGNNAMKYGRLIKFMLDKVHDIVTMFSVSEDKRQLAASDEFQRVLHHCLALCSSWIDHFTQQPSTIEEKLDLKVLTSIRRLVYTIWPDDSVENVVSLKDLYLLGLMRIIEAQRLSFELLVRVQGTIRARRAVRQRVCNLRAEFIGAVFCEIGNLLSKHLFTMGEGKMRRSQVLAADGEANDSVTPAKLAILCEATLWFCDYTGLSSMQADTESATSSFVRPIADRLLVPLAVAVVSLCGSGSCTRPASAKSQRSGDKSMIDEDKPTDWLCLAEFLDSDASAHEFSDNEDNDEVDDNQRNHHKELLRVVCHIVHCIGIVFGCVGQKDVTSFESSDFYGTENGPLLPLVVSRVLNHVADTLLVEFENEDAETEEGGVWSRDYPFGTGGIGALLDSALYKAYKCLHGFTLSGSSEQYSAKEHVSIATGEVEIKSHAPESHQAAAQLYRCIFRRKKTPPKAALEAVSSALPPLRESDKSRKIRQFIFSSDPKLFSIDDIVSTVTKASNWERQFEIIQEWEQADSFQSGETPENEPVGGSNDDEEVTRMRKGIFAHLSQGDLPIFSNESGSKDDDRVSAIRFEKELTKKFNAILNTLCFAETFSIRGWFRASQCLLGMQEVVSDRLGVCKGYSRSNNFKIPEERPPTLSRFAVAPLKARQEQASQAKELGWIQFLGDDLSLYVKHQWASFDSLMLLSKELLDLDDVAPAAMQPGDDIAAFMLQIKNEISVMQKKGRLADWQQAWGGMFVSALKKMAIRCMCVAVFIFHERASVIKKEDQSLLPEILESLGTVLYASMMGSQNYGYPMHIMELHRKRQISIASRVCFQSAIDVAQANSKDKKAETWDLLFMIGKCHEKIAGTFKLETYSARDPKDEAFAPRQFELKMTLALRSYRDALDEKPESDNGEAGGSSHGATEVVYRLHASRLKCLLLAGSASEQERDVAEEEALRLTELYWYSPPGNLDTLEGAPVRDRVWDVLTDIVSALVKCRLEHSFFHRSVYRHAQALMWAPVLCDPVAGRAEGSKSTVPATKSYKVRGLNHATNSATSALSVLSTLFEKKRSQLCAVWVTTAYPPTSFETVNNSVRKYDSIRGKYIAAYIESLRLCGNRSELETLLRWISSSKRDLPSLFCTSALAGGGRPDKSHTNDSLLIKSRSLSSFHLLTGLKRRANSAMAFVLKEELLSKESTVRYPENHLRLAYACFLRLNCTVKELKKTRAWKHEPGGVSEAEALTQAYLKLGHTKNIVADPNDWSGGGQKAAVLEAALQKCKELFPSVSGAFYSKKAIQKSKSQGDSECKDGSERATPAQLSGTKRSFEVEVPEGLGEGETFTTTIGAGGNNKKKVKLTVPAGKPRMLRFSIDLSTQATD